MVRIRPQDLPPLEFPALKPSERCTDSAGVIADQLGGTLSPPDKLRLASGWTYSLSAAEHFENICRQFFRHTKGRWAGEPMVWHNWQLEQWVRPIFGWYTHDGHRGVKRVYIECGKKSGKSTFAAAVALYMANFFGEAGAEVYCLASTAEQAKIVQTQVQHMVDAAPELSARAMCNQGSATSAATIKWPHTSSFVKSMTGKGASGFNPSCVIMDELHEWAGTESFDKWTYGSAAREGWLHLAITNAGDDTESVCFRQREYCRQVMAGDVDDPTYYGRIYGASREQAEAEIESVVGGATRLPVAAQCNPGLGSVLHESDLVTEIKRAVHIPSEMPNLLRFWYCVWRVAADLEWLVRWWDDCGRDYTLDDLQEQPCWLGMDLSSVCDLSAVVLVAHCDDGVCRQWPLYWVPRYRAKELRKYTAIEVWERDDHIKICPGKTIDQPMISQTICELYETHDVRGIVYDPREAALIIREVEERTGMDQFPFKQSHENYHEATDNYEGDVRSQKMLHPHHPILSWQAKHAMCKETTHGYRKPIKPDPDGAPHKTVDGVQAAVMAYSQARLYQDDEVVAYALG